MDFTICHKKIDGIYSKRNRECGENEVLFESRLRLILK